MFSPEASHGSSELDVIRKDGARGNHSCLNWEQDCLWKEVGFQVAKWGGEAGGPGMEEAATGLAECGSPAQRSGTTVERKSILEIPQTYLLGLYFHLPNTKTD